MSDPIVIMLVEDNPSDRELTRLALTRAKLVNRVLMAEDGEEALELLADPDVPRPDLILLDLNMPGMDGRELLKRLKESPEYCTIPVVVLTTSESADDVDDAYRHFCSGYITKPIGLDSMHRIVQAIDGYWFAIVKRPS